MKLKKGDTVKVISGKDKGQQGEIVHVFPSDNKVLVNGINTAKKHSKARRANQQGGIIDRDMPIPVSNVAIVCKTDGRTRVGYEVDANGVKTRVCKKCGGEL